MACGEKRSNPSHHPHPRWADSNSRARRKAFLGLS